jgi:plasmid stabilization system protein ParE
VRAAEPFAVFVDATAEEDIERVDAWWQEHAASRDLFRDELAHMFALLASSPQMGVPYRRRGIPGLRRVLLRATRYHVYYVFDGSRVIVLSVWSAVRRRGPRLG